MRWLLAKDLRILLGEPLRMLELQKNVQRILRGRRQQILDALKLIQSDATIHGGSSGGALVDRFGNVVGISVSGFTVSERKVGTSINFFIPVADALKFLAVELVEKDLS